MFQMTNPKIATIPNPPGFLKYLDTVWFSYTKNKYENTEIGDRK